MCFRASFIFTDTKWCIFPLFDKSIQLIDTISELAGLPSGATLNEALITSVTVLRGETIVKHLNAAKAGDNRDAASKALFGRLFSWVIQQLNTRINPAGTQGEAGKVSFVSGRPWSVRMLL